MRELIRKISPSYIAALTTQGKYENPSNLGRLMLNQKDPVFIIGGFSKGHFTKETLKLSDQTISIFSKGLESWTVASRAIFAYEQALELSYRSNSNSYRALEEKPFKVYHKVAALLARALIRCV